MFRDHARAGDWSSLPFGVSLECTLNTVIEETKAYECMMTYKTSIFDSENSLKSLIIRRIIITYTLDKYYQKICECSLL